VCTADFGIELDGSKYKMKGKLFKHSSNYNYCPRKRYKLM
jgi:hypothetical protein